MADGFGDRLFGEFGVDELVGGEEVTLGVVGGEHAVGADEEGSDAP